MTARRFRIGNKWIGDNAPVFIIAEAGVNHNGNIKLATKLIDAAKEAGADAVKFQSFKTESIITPYAQAARYHLRSMGGNISWYNLLKKLELSEEGHCELFSYCKKRGILFLSTPYDEESARFLDKLGVSLFKIASCDINNIPFLKHLSAYGKPILLATGMSEFSEIKTSVKVLQEARDSRIIIMQCTSNYPPASEDANLNVIDTFKKELGILTGYSDHLCSYRAAIASVAKGVCAYEVHFTLDKDLSGPDHRNSVEPPGLKKIIEDIRFTEKLLGSSKKAVTGSERETRNRLRRSIVANSDIRRGSVFTKDNLGIKRPSSGLAPGMLYYLLGRAAKKDILKDSLIKLEDVNL